MTDLYQLVVQLDARAPKEEPPEQAREQVRELATSDPFLRDVHNLLEEAGMDTELDYRSAKLQGDSEDPKDLHARLLVQGTTDKGRLRSLDEVNSILSKVFVRASTHFAVWSDAWSKERPRVKLGAARLRWLPHSLGPGAGPAAAHG